MKYGTFTRFFRTALLILFASMGQLAFAGHNFNYGNNGVSDYRFDVSWANLYGAYHCPCSGTTYIYAVTGNWTSTSNSANWLWGTSQSYDNSATSGSLEWVVGPSYSQDTYISVWYTGITHNSGCTCTVSAGLCPAVTCNDRVDVSIGGSPLSVATHDIYPPVSLTATNSVGIDYVDLTWQKASYIPDSLLSYKIYRDNVLIATVPATGSSMSYHDANLSVATTYNYYVETYTSSWGGHTSVPTYATGSTYSANLQATDGTYYGKSSLSWQNLSHWAANDIEVRRNGVQLAIVNKNSTTYNDFDGVEGVKYLYEVAAIDSNNVTLPAYKDSGYSRPNGVIKGNVRTIFSAGVSGVTLYAYATVDGNNILDSAVSDASGFYQFNDLYYDTSAVYTIVPHKNTHHFNPDTLTRILALNNNIASGVDFTDTSVFTIKGTVRFSADPHCANCTEGGVSIYQNGINISNTTAGNGTYAIAIQTEGDYTFKPVMYNHKFSPDSIMIHVSSDSFGVDFTDLARDTIQLSLLGGCANQVADHAIVAINSNSGNYASFDTFPGLAGASVIVPAQPYTVNFLKGFTSPVFEDPLFFTALGSSPIAVDASHRDTATLTHIDTVYNNVPASTVTLVSGQVITIPAHTDTIIDTLTNTVTLPLKAAFVYHGQITVDVPNFPLSTVCPTLNSGLILDQGDQVPLHVTVTESYTYSAVTCPVDSGQLVIYDDVSDAGGAQTVNFYNGEYDYTVIPGSPNIALPYLKVLQFFAHVGNVTNPTWGRNILVTGHKPHTQTFVTKTPELPFFILHAPPGNNSYSYLAQDSSVSYNYSNSYQIGGSAGPYVDAKIGAGIPIPFTGITVGAGVEITADAQAGGDQNHNTEVNSTFMAHQQISTSNINGNNATNSLYSGHQGDVYVGGSFNMIYALTDVIELKNCQVVRDTQLAWGANGLATNYIYTEDHIVNTLIPQLQLLKSLSHGDTVLLIQSYIDVWNQVVQKNHHNTDTASTFVQNISFSAGAVYDNSVTTTTDSTQTIDYTTFLDVNAGVGAIFGENLDEFENTQVGVKMNFHWNMNTSNSTNVVKEKTFAYHLEDDEIGNFYSVDVKKDNAYGTPCFGVVAGTGSCPHWPGTQARDSVQISLDNYSQSNVPINSPATYVAHIVNLSESQETRTYNIQAVPESNTEGAIIKIGGQQINNSSAAFTIAAGTDLPVVLTVERGPIASDYNGLQISASSPCDGGEGNTITFEAHFQSTCSPIGLYTPSDNWLVNAASHDSLPIIFSGYNANDSNLISIGLEYRTVGGSWVPATNPAIGKSLLVAPYYDLILNTSALPDGDYEIRAFANCGSQPGGITYSQTLSGKIDRTSLQLFGTPSPSDGVLNVTQNISVSFNGAVNCLQAATYSPIFSSLVRADNGQVIPDSVTCNGNQLIIYTNPPSLIDSLENVTLTATINNVYDLNGNTLSQPVVWSFLVSRSKVYWNPSNININEVTGTTASATANMLNTGPLDTFTIIHMPSWLSTPQSAMYIVNPGTPTNPSSLPVTFTAQNSLNPGHYSDTVVALANGKKLFLFVNLDVVKPHPNWTVNPANYQYSMNITTNYSITQLDAPLSTDTRDTIAVFKGGECRGYAGITYDPYTNRYVAFLTAYSNSVVGDTFTFRMWDAVPGTEYQAKERLAFVDNGTIGQPLAPYILHPEGVFQTIPVVPGWNWFSLNVSSTPMGLPKVLNNTHPDTTFVVKTDNAYAQYTETPFSLGWQGTLNTFTTSKSYMIHVDHPDTLRILGQPVTDTSIVQIASGWNWIGYPRQNISSALSYLSNVNAADGDILKTQSVFTQYHGGIWSGTLNNMYPGQGYKLRTANAFNFVIPPDRSLPSWNVDDNLFQQNQTVTADLQFDGVSTTQSHYLVGAFANNVCIGVAQPIYLTDLGLYRVFMTLHGDTANSAQPISFKVYDTDNDIEYVPSYAPISIVPDTTVATVTTPYVINVQFATGINALTFSEGYSLLQNVPNPFSKNTSIEYVIPAAQQVTITLYDEAGRLVAELVNGKQAAGRHQVSFAQEDLQSGVYLYQMKSGDFVKTRRMLILK